MPRTPPAEPIAILGAACRFPGAPDLDAFWSLLAEGRDAVSTLPADRFNQDWFHHPRREEAGRSYSFAAGHLGDIAGFDPAHFGLSPREAAEADPQQRLLLEVAWEALEDAGWPASSVAGREIGVFVGGSSTDYAELRLSDPSGADRYFMTGNTLSILGNRITNVLDLRGGAQTIDTACSSSLVALSLAVDSLRAGRVEAALVGGVQLLLSPYAFTGFSRASMLSPSGRCHVFSAAADGYVRGEGAGMVVLKPLSAALAAGDPVRGVILAAGVNAVGRSIGLSLPDPQAQAALLRKVLAEAGLPAGRVGYFEAHGTGTQAGDPVEAQAIGEALAMPGAGDRGSPLPVGSVKSNIGHLETASGMAGLLKALLMLERRVIPPNLHLGTPNPRIDFAGLGIRVPTAPEPLPGDEPVIGVNSFGFGGTNASLLLAAPPPVDAAPETEAAALPPLLLSARSAEALPRAAAAWAEALRAAPGRAPALLRGLARHRDLAPHRLVLRAGDAEGLAEALEGFAAGEPRGVQGTAPALPAPGPVFAFSGNGSQFPGMARDAMAGSRAFREAVEAADAEMAPHLGWSVAAALADGLTAEALAATEVAQPALFAVQHGLVAALAGEGIAPALVLGHSVGEVAAALAAGILDLPGAARLIVARSAAQARTRGKGRMAALNATEAEAAPLLAACGPGLEIAARNAPRALTVAGPAEAIARLAVAARQGRLSFVPLDLDYAFHSAAMDEVEGLLRESLAGLRPAAPRIPFLSAVTGTLLDAPADAEYWWRNLRAPVRFAEAAAEAGRLGARPVIEIGPNPILQSYLREALREALRPGGSEAPILASLSRRDPPGDPVPAIADRATALGADPRTGPAFAGPALRRGLPRTPYARRRHWFPATPETHRLHDPVLDHPLLGFRREADAAEAGFATWTRDLDAALLPWLGDHRLGEEAVLPAAAMVEMALAAGLRRFPEAEALEVSTLQILRPLPIPGAEPGAGSQEVRFRLGDDGVFRLESRRRMTGEAWSLHARGLLRPATAEALPALPPPPPAGRRVEETALHAAAARCGLDYGPAFRPVLHVDLAPSGRAAEVALGLPAGAPEDAPFLLHPVRLDGAMQGLIGLLADRRASPAGEALVPVRFERLVVRRDAAPATRAALALTHAGERAAEARMVLGDAAGRPVAVAEGVWFQRARLGRAEAAEAAVFRLEDVPAADPALPPPEGGRLLDLAMAAAGARDESLDLSETALLLEGYVAAAAMAAFSGDDGRDGASPRPVLPATPYAAALLRALEEDGLAEREGAGWRLLPADDLPAPGEIWRSVLIERPALAGDLAALALAAERLPDALAGHLPPEDAAPGLPEESAAADRLAQVLADAAGAVAAAWPAERPLRVLDLGGAALTRHLATALARAGRRVQQVLAGPTRPAPAPQPTLEVVPLDWDPAGGAPPPLTADLVVGVAPAMRGGAGTGLLPGLAAALAEGGLLLLAEPLPGRVIDFARGQEAGSRSAPPLPGLDAWRGALAAEGWAAARVEALQASPWPAAILAAQRPTPVPATPTAAPPRRHVLLADSGAAPLGEALAAALSASGAAVEIHRLEDAASLPPRLLRDAAVVALANPAPLALPTTLAGLSSLAGAASGAARSLALVAQGDPACPAAEAVRALGRVLANEMPDLAPRRITVDAALAPAAAARRLLPELLTSGAETAAEAAPGAEPELVLGLSARRVPRIVTGQPPGPALPARLAVRQPGALSSLGWEPMEPLPAPGPGEVRIRVEAAGLNFRDLMWAQGLLPEETLKDGFAGAGLGMECAGVVEAAGPGVLLHPGTRVFGFAPRALASRVLTRAEAVVPVPEGLSPAAAATIPVAFLTAVYALESCARLLPGERVLIHGGAGAVGLAALQVAGAAGAQVAMTAGTPAKRAFLRAAGADLVLDSRAAGFDDALRRHWPEGVDVVLNSLAGEAMERSLALLRPFGRFVELGKRDYAEDRRVAVRPFRRNITYFGVDVDQLPRARPAEAARLLEAIRGRLAIGDLRPLPYARRAAEDAEGAFRLLQASGHIGKIVLTPPRGDAQPVPDWSPRGGGTILVTGGASGFGLECAKWLAAGGASRLALLSRRGPATPGAAEAVTALAALGARASLHAVDASNEAALAAVLAELREEGPVTGVVHAAAVFDDGAATAMNAARFARVLAPKLSAAENLDRLTAGDPLDLFLLFSSATTALGNPGQANYVAANAGLEALARRRRAAGRPALAIGWGPIGDAGILARDAETARTLGRRLGVEPMAARESLEALPALIASGVPAISLARVAWKRVGAALPVLREPAFAALRGRAEEADADIADMRAHLAALPAAEARALLTRIGAEELGRILRLPPESIAPDAPVARLGLDSLGGLELRGALEARLGMTVPLSAVTEDLTVAGLAARVAEGLSGGGREAGIDALLDSFEPGAATPPTPEPTPADAATLPPGAGSATASMENPA
ncbi:acyl transferase domain-containing protein/NADPH:quinone reductase-like Zn-dependent oxidoreductase/acyl carrier protein [Roseomonas pecuniae]|uniref:Acyl transferase domain-containing protein/NADPH:quinone reductase-like Zn-dependent oxidoreductase/acyl carrier protein n=2 Tax=Muricoccus pecuniae TaxID=693023 RepID=A0A840XWB1_9PROT|nr:acyl transferase domain-containing protein/NADPH:quinone reductase-like Zn-dependent oxidoreductase/acyl carrier protein [Roseomonas pecuniae]